MQATKHDLYSDSNLIETIERTLNMLFYWNGP